MTIDANTRCTTAELRAIVELTPGRLSQLENIGTIHRVGKDQWPLVETLRALLRAAREASEQYSKAKARTEEFRAKREELRLMKETGQVCPASDFDGFVDFVIGKILPIFGSLPARIAQHGPHDIDLRRYAETVVRDGQRQIADACQAEADRLLKKDGGKAA